MALYRKSAELLDACDAEPDGDRRLACAAAHAAAPTAKNARRLRAALATSKRWGLLAEF